MVCRWGLVSKCSFFLLNYKTSNELRPPADSQSVTDSTKAISSKGQNRFVSIPDVIQEAKISSLDETYFRTASAPAAIADFLFCHHLIEFSSQVLHIIWTTLLGSKMRRNK